MYARNIPSTRAASHLFKLNCRYLYENSKIRFYSYLYAMPNESITFLFFFVPYSQMFPYQRDIFIKSCMNRKPKAYLMSCALTWNPQFFYKTSNAFEI